MSSAGPGGRASLSTPRFADLWRELERIGRDPQTGGYRRYYWTEADAQCRAWFTGQAERRGLTGEPGPAGGVGRGPGETAVAAGPRVAAQPLEPAPEFGERRGVSSPGAGTGHVPAMGTRTPRWTATAEASS